MHRRDRLSLLFVTPWLPYPPISGFRTRVFHVMRELARRHDVTLLTYARPEEAADVEELRGVLAGVDVVPRSRPLFAKKRRAQAQSLLWRRSYQSGRLHSAGMQHAIDAALAARPHDIVQIESSMLGIFDFHTGAPLVLDEHNIEYEIFARTFREEREPARRLFNLVEYLKFRREERRAWERADGIVLTSARERDILARELPGKPLVEAPNGVDITYFAPTAGERDSDQIVFSGLMSYRPNVDAVTYFVREILPLIRERRPRAHFTIVGADPQAEVQRLAGQAVEVTGRVPDVRPYLARAGAVVVPLRFGSGTRLKVLEGLAMAAPMVSTSIGSEGIDVVSGEHLQLADTAETFAAAVLRLLDTPATGAALGHHGRRLVENQYAWPSVARRLESFYELLLAPPVGNAAAAAV